VSGAGGEQSTWKVRSSPNGTIPRPIAAGAFYATPSLPAARQRMRRQWVTAVGAGRGQERERESEYKPSLARPR
jgi:hypothetical protein